MLNRIIHFYIRRFWSGEKYARYIGVKIGKSCSIHTKDFGSEPYLVEIGDHVQITHGVKFFTHSGGWIFRSEYPKLDAFGKIKIRSNVYIGNNVLILPGVTIGNNVMIGAGAVVTKSIPDDSVAAGNPARIISDTLTTKKRMILKNLNTKGLSPEEKKRILLSMPEDKFIQK